MTTSSKTAPSTVGRDTRPTVFVSYSHRDEPWKREMLPQFEQLVKAGLLEVWDDRQIRGGEDWYARIKEILDRSRFAVCLISADFLSSSFCMDEEIPFLLQSRRKGKLEILPILLRPCVWQAHRWLQRLQMLPRDGRSVAIDFPGDAADAVFAEAATQVYDALQPGCTPPPPPPPTGTPPEKVDIDRLPETGSLLFGRRDELQVLDGDWEDPTTRIVIFKAFGGVGKSTLVRCWCEEMAEENFRGARKVYAWSFYSQGTGERVTSSDLFIATALEWFGDPDPTQGSPWDKAGRLADLIAAEKTLLLLDGLEPLQSDNAFDRGAIRDPAIKTLLSALAANNPGLCIVTTREAVVDLMGKEFSGPIRHLDLEQVSIQAGRALLRTSGVTGRDEELERTVERFGRHALALNLLKTYLRDYHDSSIAGAYTIPELDLPAEQHPHPRRVMLAFDRRFSDGPEINLLRILGLFDRPAEAAWIDAVRVPPAIPHLTDRLQNLSDQQWNDLLATVRRSGLIAAESRHRPDAIDAHPLVREHFGAQLREKYSDAWVEGNRRLYDLFFAKMEYSSQISEMQEFVICSQAIYHGCIANKQKECYELFEELIRRSDEFGFIRGSVSVWAELSALSNFFEKPWERVSKALDSRSKGQVLQETGHALRSLGRLREAEDVLKSALEVWSDNRNWERALVSSGHLCRLFVMLGDLNQALTYANDCLDFAEREKEHREWRRMVSLTARADVLHQMGQIGEASAIFAEADGIRAIRRPSLPYLDSVQGFEYCDLLLSQGRWQEVMVRSRHTYGWATKHSYAADAARDRLSFGRSQLMAAAQGDRRHSRSAEKRLNQAVDEIRLCERLDYLPLGLLARAALARANEAYSVARRDIEEAMIITRQGRMKLFEVDTLLEYARLHLAEKDADKACESLEKAKTLIEETGYHRRNGEVSELEKALAWCGMN